MKIKFKKIIPFFIGIFILIFFVSYAGFSDVLSVLAFANSNYILLGALVLSVTLGLMSLRWYFLLKKQLGVKFSTSTAVLFLGVFVNEFLPTGSGEITRIISLKKLKKSISKPLTAILIERVFDVFVLLLIGIMGINLFFLEGIGNFYFSGFFAGLVILLVVLIFYKPEIVNKFIRYLPVKGAEENFVNAVKIYRKKYRLLVLALALTFAIWLNEALTQTILLMGFGQSVSFFVLVGVVGVSWIIGTFSFLPGGLGAREITYALLLSIYGVPLAVSISVGVTYRFFVYLEYLLFLGISSKFAA